MSKVSLQLNETVDSTVMEQTEKRNGHAKTIRSVVSKITVEPMVCLYMFSYIITAMTTQNLNLDKACNVNLKFDSSVCDAIKSRNASGYDISQEVQIQKFVASIYTWKFVIHSTFAVLILAFVGSRSDRNGRRKIVILAPLFGEICTLVGLITCTYFFNELPMEFNVVSETISIALAGGMNTFLVGAITIICVQTTIEERTIRVGITHILFHMGLTVALGSSGILIYYLGFYGVYGLALSLHLLSTFYGILVIKEEKRKQILNKKVGFFKDFFDVKSLKSSFNIVFKNKDKLKKKKIMLTMLIAMMVVGPMQGEIGVMYLYTRYKYQWNEVDFGIFFAFASLVHVCGSSVGMVIFSKLLKMDDALMGCISVISKIAGSLAYAFAPTGTVFYMAIGVDALSTVLAISMRAIVTKQATPDEIGQMNAIFGLAEALVPLAYGPLYSATYRSTIEIFPGMFYILSSILTIPVFIIFLWLYKNRTPQIVEKPEDLEKMENLLAK